MNAPVHPDLAVWLSTPHTAMVEIARDLGFGRLVLDLEHGMFDLDPTDRLVAYARALGFQVYAKVLGPQAIPIQQALDIGCDGVIIPHILGVEHAAAVCRAAKYPPLGDRSFAGGRTVRYDAPPDGWFAAENERQLCFPMIESAAALADIDAILGLATVDGVFVGPSDLALSRGRDRYRFDAADQADLRAIAEAANAAGKTWIMPAWTAGEQELSAELGAQWRVVADETGSIYSGLASVLDAMKGHDT
jgi:4-hydroxy-2-oxoheptanedioate aldolase